MERENSNILIVLVMLASLLAGCGLYADPEYPEGIYKPVAEEDEQSSIQNDELYQVDELN